MSKIYSRYELFNLFKQECARAKRNTERLNMAVFQFKGGLCFNIVLYLILKSLLKRLRVTDYLGWCGPCSFVILMPDISMANVIQAAAAIKKDCIPWGLICQVDLLQYPGDFQDNNNHKSKDVLEMLSQAKAPIKIRMQRIFMSKKKLIKTDFPESMHQNRQNTSSI